MEDDFADSYLIEADETGPRYCEDCRVLTEALRDMELQCREAEDERFRTFSPAGSGSLDIEEERYLARISKLQRRRDCALEVLLKHQSLEHKERT